MPVNNHLWILIHGTFAGDAPWTKPDSVLSQSIARHPFNSVRRFNWSGRNSGIARYQAARELADMICAVQGDYDAVSMVAHSHGGNIVRLALESDGVRPVENCIFLGTPFILAWRRDVERLLRANSIALVTALLLMVWNATGFGLPFPVASPLAVAALLLMVVFYIAYVFRDYAGRLFPKSEVVTRRRDYVFYCQPDEANKLLRTAEFLPNLGSAVLRFLSNVALVCGMHWKTIIYAVPLAVVLVLLSGEKSYIRLPFDLAVWLMLSAMVSLVLIVMIGTAWFLLSAILRFSPTSFGYEGLLSLLNLELRVSRYPCPAEAGAITAFSAVFGRRSRLTLFHSAFYDDPGIVEMIGCIAGGEELVAKEHVRSVPIESPPARPEPKKFGRYTLPAFLLGIFLLTLLSETQSMLEVADDREAGIEKETSYECDLRGVCTELNNFDPDFVDGCTVEPDGSCTPPK